MIIDADDAWQAEKAPDGKEIVKTPSYLACTYRYISLYTEPLRDERKERWNNEQQTTNNK